MKKALSFAVVIAVELLGSAPVWAAPPLSCGPSAVQDIDAAVSFVLRSPYADPAMRGAPSVGRGLAIVVHADPALIEPRAEATPVLYAGASAAEIVCASSSGRLLVLVPGNIDLEAVPIWFGPPAFPDKVTPSSAAGTLEDARAAGVRPLPGSSVQAARARGGRPIMAADRAELFERLRPLAEEYCWR